ncbi:MAG: hypothetical protein AB1468_01100 [Candidatus Micrarchaeota archaeon]
MRGELERKVSKDGNGSRQLSVVSGRHEDAQMVYRTTFEMRTWRFGYCW